MKKTFSVFALFLTVGCTIAFAQGAKFKKQKDWTKSYTVSASDKISLDNQFGEMKLITWDKNQVQVDVNISTGADDESAAQAMLDLISVKDEKNAGGVSFTTVIGNHDKSVTTGNKHGNTEMKINFTVHLPAGSPLFAKNKFGSMIVPDYRGEANLDSEFGSLTAGKITNAQKVHVGFGTADIESVNNGTLDIQYSTATIHKVTGAITANFQFCSAVKLNIDNSNKKLDITNSYSTVYLDLDKSLAATYHISTDMGSFKNQSNFKIDRQDGNNAPGKTSAVYSGASGNGDAKITVKSTFGSVIAGHDLHVDMTPKKKQVSV